MHRLTYWLHGKFLGRFGARLHDFTMDEHGGAPIVAALAKDPRVIRSEADVSAALYPRLHAECEKCGSVCRGAHECPPRCALCGGFDFEKHRCSAEQREVLAFVAGGRGIP